PAVVHRRVRTGADGTEVLHELAQRRPQRRRGSSARMHRSGHRLRASVRGETVSVVLNPSHLVGSDNLPGNHYAFCIDLQSPWFLSKGAMIAYYGQVQFT